MRRVHVDRLSAGARLVLSEREAHHARNVLRLTEGTEVEVFDDAGQVARGRLTQVSPAEVVVEIGQIDPPQTGGRIMVAAAVPKGSRADWMVEKLSELGVSAFVPLRTERSVVHPEGHDKIARWERLAKESAKQARRNGVMSVAPLTTTTELIAGFHAESTRGFYLSTSPGAPPFVESVDMAKVNGELLLLIGPEGGWTDAEEKSFDRAGLTGAGLTGTILRVETAAIAAAALAACVARRHDGTRSGQDLI